MKPESALTGLARLALGIAVALVAGLIIWFNGLRYPRRDA
jgi:hypothetical protein